MLNGVLSGLGLIKDQWGELHRAVQMADETLVDSILNSWLKPSLRYSEKNEVFMLAISHPHILVKLIHAYGPEIPNDHSFKLFELASENGDANVVDALLKVCGKDLQCHKGYVLTLAAEKGHTDVVTVLLNDHHSTAIEIEDLTRAIRDAAGNGHVDTVGVLFEKHGEKINSFDKCEALGDLIRINSHANGVLVLLKGNCAEVFSHDPKYYGFLVNTALSYAFCHGEVLEEVLKPSIKELSLDNSIWAFNVAIDNGHVNVITMLLQENNKITDKNLEDGVRCAAHKGHVGVVRVLLEFGTNILYSNKLLALNDLIENHSHIEGVVAILEAHCETMFAECSKYNGFPYEILINTARRYAADKSDIMKAVLKPSEKEKSTDHSSSPITTRFDSKKKHTKKEMKDIEKDLDAMFEHAYAEIEKQAGSTFKKR